MKPEESSEKSTTQVPQAAEHIDHLEGLVYSALEGTNLNDAGAATQGGGETPAGAMGAWEYWGNGTYYERGPDGGYSGGCWTSGDET